MMRRYSPVACSLAVLVLALTAMPALAQEGEPETPVVAPDEPVVFDSEGRSAYGLYLAGRLAATEGEAAIGADYLRQAQMLAPGNEDLQLQAFTSALIGGDLAYAARLAPEGKDVPPVLAEIGRLAQVVQLIRNGQAAQAQAMLAAEPIGRPHARAGLYLSPFVAAEAGNWEAALAPVPGDGTDLDSLFLRYHRALLLEIRGYRDEADAQYRQLISTSTGRQLFVLTYGEFLERQGRRAEALTLYDETRAIVGDAPNLMQARARAEARGRPPAAPTLRRATAMALENAALRATAEDSHEFAAVYLRLAHDLYPNPETLLNVGISLAEADLEIAARQAFARIGPEAGPAYVDARLEAARSYQRDGMPEQALGEVERAFAARPNDASIAYMLAAQLSNLERYEEALVLAEGPLLNTAEQGYAVHLLRGGIYESLGRIDEAEAELWAANMAKPDDPTVLNYLGYIWVDSGRRVEQGAELIQRAAEIDPDNINIQDSLGWARYHQGDFEGAVEILEQAVDGQPANPVINDHLGDAYWQVGRRREAIFQWNRVLTLEPDSALRAEAERKIEGGLPSGS